MKIRKIHKKWDLVSLSEESLKYKTRKELSLGSSGAYYAAGRLGVLDKICSHMDLKVVEIWDINKALNEAKKYNNRSEFRKKSCAYHYLWRHKLLDEACSHMRHVVIWNAELATNEAKKHQNRTDFCLYKRAAYDFLVKNGTLNEACSHMREVIRWDRLSSENEAKKYNTRKEFFYGTQGAYKYAQENGFLQEICSHMEIRFGWDIETVMEKAKDYSLRSKFMEDYPGAYAWSKNNGLFDEVVKHMDDGITGFDKTKEATLYYLRFNVENADPVYKIGITNTRIRQRINGMKIYKNVTYKIIEEIKFDNGADAYEMEQGLHKEFAEYQYTGKQIIGNGFTELFTKDVLGYD